MRRAALEKMMNEENKQAQHKAAQPVAGDLPPLPLLEAAQDLLTWIEAKHRPPQHDNCGTMALVRLHALATLADSVAAAMAMQPVQQPAAVATIGNHKAFELAAKALHQDWTPEKVHRLIEVVDAYVLAHAAPVPAAGVRGVIAHDAVEIPLPEPASNWPGFPFSGTHYFTKPQLIALVRSVQFAATVQPDTGRDAALVAELRSVYSIYNGHGEDLRDLADRAADRITALAAHPASLDGAGLDMEVLGVFLDQIHGAHGTAMQNAYCPSSEPFKAAQKRFYAAVENLRGTLEAAAHPANGAQAGDAEEDAYVIDRMGKLLAGVAIALKGPEQALHRHGYQDLVEVAQTLMLELELYRDHIGVQSCAAYDVLAERRRQIEKEGYDTAHDDEHANDEIAAYATFYAMPPAARDWPATETGYGATWGEAIIPEQWGPAKPGDRRGELVKAGALVIAEIERLDRAAAPQTKKG